MIRLTAHEYMFGRPYSPSGRDDVVKKLWEYEETGLSPEDIRRIDKSYRELATELAKYKKAEKEIAEIKEAKSHEQRKKS